MREHKERGSSTPSSGRWEIFFVPLLYPQQTTWEKGKDRGKLPVAVLTS